MAEPQVQGWHGSQCILNQLGQRSETTSKKKQKDGWGCKSVMEGWLAVSQVLGSIPRTAQHTYTQINKGRTHMPQCIPTQGDGQIQRDLKGSQLLLASLSVPLPALPQPPECLKVTWEKDTLSVGPGAHMQSWGLCCLAA